VNTTSLDVDSIAHGIGLLLRIFLLRIRDRQLPFENQMGGKASVGVWTVVGVSVAKVSPVSRRGGYVSRQTYGPSVQVNTCENPHVRTSCSDSRCDFAVIVVVVLCKESCLKKRCIGGQGWCWCWCWTQAPRHAPCNGPGRMNLGPCLPWRGRVEQQRKGARHTRHSYFTRDPLSSLVFSLLPPLGDDSAMYCFLAASRHLKPDSICVV
jgi:hypothetical protein